MEINGTPIDYEQCAVAVDGSVIWRNGKQYIPLRASPITNERNVFGEAQSVTELMYMLVGAASMCWVGGTGDAEFDTTRARDAADAGIERLIEMGWA